MPRQHLAFALSLVCPALAFGQAGAALVPENASVAAFTNDVSALRARAARFIKDHGLRLRDSPAAWLSGKFEYLGVKKGLDEKGPAAVFMPKLSIKGDPGPQWGLGLLAAHCFVFPVKDAAEAAGNFRLKADDLKGGKIQTSGGAMAPYRLMLKGKHLYISPIEKILTLASAAKPLSGALSASQKAALARADLAFHLGGDKLGVFHGRMIDQAEKVLVPAGEQEGSRYKALFNTLRQIKLIAAGVTLQEEGASAAAIATILAGKDGATALKFLAGLRAGKASDLAGLPSGRPLLLFASSADGATQVALARALINTQSDQRALKRMLPGKDRAELVAAVEKLCQEIRGSRVALYANEAKASRGRFALVAVLDVEAPDKHLAEWPDVLKRLNGALAKAYKDDKAIALGYEPKAEKIEGVDVHLVRARAARLPAEYTGALKGDLGPDWGKVRLAVVGKKLAVLVGSNVALLKETIANLKKGAKGLAADRAVAAAQGRLSKGRVLEYHVDLAGVPAALRDKAPGPLAGLMSLGLAASADELRLEVAVTKADVKTVVEWFNLAERE